MAKGKARTKLLDHSAGLVEGNAAGESWNFLYQASTVKHPDYNIGDRVKTPDGRTFRYGYARNTLGTTMACKSWGEEIVKYATVAASVTLGSATVTVTVAVTDGYTANGAIAADELRGGYVVIYNTGDVVRQHRSILGNTAVAAGGGTLTIYLDGGVTTALTASNDVEILGNPYYYLYSTNDTYSSCLGVAMRAATVGQYVWIQTWGPICLSPGGAGVGGATEERECVFGGNGALFEHNVGDSSDQRQHAGFILNRDSVGGDGPPFIMLQISP